MALKSTTTALIICDLIKHVDCHRTTLPDNCVKLNKTKLFALFDFANSPSTRPNSGILSLQCQILRILFCRTAAQPVRPISFRDGALSQWKQKCSLVFCTMTTGLADTPKGQRESALGGAARHLLWLQIAIISSLTCILFAKALIDMAHDWWHEPELSQGMLLPPLALFVAWIERSRILSSPATADRRGILLSAFACCMFVLGKLASEFFLMRFSFVILVTGLIWTFWGLKRLRALAFPLLLLAVMVPLPAIVYNSIAAPLQLFASDVASQMAQAAGVSVFRDGNIIQLAGISLGVAEACSGLSCLSALIVGSLLLGYLLCTRKLSRILLLIAAVPLAIAVNVVRVAGTAVLADYNQAFAMGFYHAFSGWLVFLAGIVVLYAIARIMHSVIDPKEAA